MVYGPIWPYDCRSHSADCCCFLLRHDEDLFFLAWFDIVPYCACQASIQDEVTAAIVVAWCAGETSEGLERSEGGRSCVACCLERPEVLETSTCCVKVYRWVVVSKISDRMK